MDDLVIKEYPARSYVLVVIVNCKYSSFCLLKEWVEDYSQLLWS